MMPSLALHFLLDVYIRSAGWMLVATSFFIALQRSFRKYTLELYDRPNAPLDLKNRMLRAEVLETMLYGFVPWSPRACHYDTLRRAHHRFLTRCIGWRKHNRADHPISYLDTLLRTGSESIEATSRRRRILFAGFVARMEDTRLPKCVIFGEMVGGAGCVGGQEKEWMGCFLDDLRAFGINADQWTTAAQTRGNVAERQNKGWNSSWQNGSLQRKPRLDYGMQRYART